MNNMVLQAAGSGSPMDMLTQFLPLIAMVAVFYFLIIMPQQKKAKETKRMLNELKKGDRIVTIGGVVATVVSLDTTEIVVTTDGTAKLTFLKSAIAEVRNGSTPTSTTPELKKD